MNLPPPEAEASQLGEQLSTMQDAYQRQAEVKHELEAELERMQQDLEVNMLCRCHRPHKLDSSKSR